MPSIKMSLLALAGAAAAVPHYGGHSRYHKPSGAHGTGAGKPYPTGGWGGFNSTRVPQPTGGNGGYPEGETTIDTTTTSTTTLLKTVTLKPSGAASSGKVVVENVTPGSGDKCGPATITVTATDKVTVTVTPGGGADVPKSSAPVAVSKDNGGGYGAPASSKPADVPAPSKPAESYPTKPAEVSSKPAAEPTPVPSKPVEGVSSAAPSATPSKAPSNGGNSYSGSKRGLAYNEAGLCKSLGGKFGFGYNWGQVENNDIGTAFIPMMHGPDKASSQEWLSNVDKAAKKGSKAVMGFNEPDHSAQANLSPEAACSAWKEYMNPIASSHPEITIIGPSVTNGPSPMGLSWLTNFGKACPDAVVHATNIHFYDIYDEGTFGRFKAHVEEAAAMNGKPVWVTEFGLNPGATEEQATAFLKDCMEYLDSNDSVQGYSYFMVGTGENQLNSGSGLSKIGEVYAAY